MRPHKAIGLLIKIIFSSIDAHERSWFLRRIRDKMCKDVQMSPTSVYEIPAPFKKGCFTDLEMTTAVLTIVAYTLAMLIAIGFCAGYNSKNCFSDIIGLRNKNKGMSDNLSAENVETGSLLSPGHSGTSDQEKQENHISSSQTDIVDAETLSKVSHEHAEEQKSEKSMKKYLDAVKNSSEKFAQKYFNLNKSENEDSKTPDKTDETTSDTPPAKPSRDQPVTPDEK